MFESHRGRHAVHAEEHPRKTGSPALAHHEGGSLHVEKPSAAHPNGVWFHDPYDRPEQPHHVHRAPCSALCAENHDHIPPCADHLRDPDGHWIGGHPQTDWPHHVEFDGSTGLWGYTRCTPEEVADHELHAAYLVEKTTAVEAEEQKKRKADRELIEKEAKRSPAFAALARRAGLID